MFIDTSGLLCCFDGDESRHETAVQNYNAAALRLTHNYVLAEFVALAQARRLPREESLAFADEILVDPEIEVVWVDSTMHKEAMQFIRSRLDKTFSLCDAVSIVLMQQRGIGEALTTDHHFDQAGFRRLLPR
jgi:predicted nucleic acid-binding protein